MTPQPNIEKWLRETPAPVPPQELLSTLERQIELTEVGEPAFSHPEQTLWWRQWRRFWLPLTSMGGAAVALILGTLFFAGGSGRSIAAASDNLNHVRSVRVIHYHRAGPGQHVTRDPRKGTNESPNFNTSIHPANPLVADEIWFRLNPQPPFRNETVTVSANETVWNSGNRELRVHRANGERTFRLNPEPVDIRTLARPIQGASRYLFEPATPYPGDVDLPAELMHCWLGQHRTHGTSINGWKPAGLVIRVWLDQVSELPRRVEWISEDYAEVSPPWIQQAYEFHDFNAVFPDDRFTFKITEADAAQLGLRLDELERLSSHAFSVHLTGEEGVAIDASINDSLGTRQVEGTLPFVFVHDPTGDTRITLRCRDGKKHMFGVSMNRSSMTTLTSRILVEVGLAGAYSIRAL